MSERAHAKVMHPSQGPQTTEFKALLQRERLAWPTVCWFIGAVILWTLSAYAGVKHLWPMWCSTLLSGVVVFGFFTVIHDSSHHAISTNNSFNDLLGSISALFYGPLTIFTLKSFRYLHMQHHLHTNEPGMDPDHWCAANNWPTRLWHWATIDLYYVYYYAKHWQERPTHEQAGLILNTLINLAIFVVLIIAGYGWQALWLWVIPGRIGIFILAYALDYLPHAPHKVLQADDPFQATKIRVGAPWLLTPLLMYHNYHLTHHLYPWVPFYRYIAVWRSGEDFFLSKHPYIVSPLGKQIDIETYKNSFSR